MPTQPADWTVSAWANSSLAPSEKLCAMPRNTLYHFSFNRLSSLLYISFENMNSLLVKRITLMNKLYRKCHFLGQIILWFGKSWQSSRRKTSGGIIRGTGKSRLVIGVMNSGNQSTSTVEKWERLRMQSSIRFQLEIYMA